MADNEHTTASLGHSEILSVKHAPRGRSLRADAEAGGPPSVGRDGWTEPGELSEDDGEIFSGVVSGKSVFWLVRVGLGLGLLATEQARDVLEQNPGGSDEISDAYELEEQSGSRAAQPSTLSSHAEILTGDSATNDIRCWDRSVTTEGSDIGPSRNIGVPPCEHLIAELVDLDLADAAHPGRLEAATDALDPGEQREVAQGHSASASCWTRRTIIAAYSVEISIPIA
jgi:hypothetical protein